MSATKPKPKLLAMVLCDTVIDDRITNKKTLVGLFNNISAFSCPCTHHGMNVYITLTDGRGEYQGRLKCINEETDRALLDLRGPIPFQSGLQVIDFNFELKNVTFPSFGRYYFEFWCDEDLLATRPFIVQKTKMELKK